MTGAEVPEHDEGVEPEGHRCMRSTASFFRFCGSSKPSLPLHSWKVCSSDQRNENVSMIDFGVHRGVGRDEDVVTFMTWEVSDDDEA